jgi:hypothetical protein
MGKSAVDARETYKTPRGMVCQYSNTAAASVLVDVLSGPVKVLAHEVPTTPSFPNKYHVGYGNLPVW